VLQQLLDWFAGLPPALLYLALFAAAAIENVFPPAPSDVVVAFGSFIAARGRGHPLGTFAFVLAGNVARAMLMYWVGRRYGAERVMRRMGAGGGGQARLEALFARWGLWALVVSRFLPGVRALVPPFAGALRLGAVRSGVAMGLASAVWYGVITYLAYTAGANFEALQARIATGQKWAGGIAAAIAVVGVAFWLLRRRRPRPDAA
jgi:membrane protein DedA with SNARE-associated domain